MIDNFRVFVSRPERLSETSRSPNIHPVPNTRAWEGIPLQPLPHPSAKDRNRPRPLPDGTPGQNMVPESAHEAQERNEGSTGDKRASKKGKGRVGESQERPAEKGRSFGSVQGRVKPRSDPEPKARRWRWWERVFRTSWRDVASRWQHGWILVKCEELNSNWLLIIWFTKRTRFSFWYLNCSSSLN